MLGGNLGSLLYGDVSVMVPVYSSEQDRFCFILVDNNNRGGRKISGYKQRLAPVMKRNEEQIL